MAGPFHGGPPRRSWRRAAPAPPRRWSRETPHGPIVTKQVAGLLRVLPSDTPEQRRLVVWLSGRALPRSPGCCHSGDSLGMGIRRPRGGAAASSLQRGPGYFPPRCIHRPPGPGCKVGGRRSSESPPTSHHHHPCLQVAARPPKRCYRAQPGRYRGSGMSIDSYVSRLYRGSGYVRHNPSTERGQYPPPPHDLADPTTSTTDDT